MVEFLFKISSHFQKNTSTRKQNFQLVWNLIYQAERDGQIF